VERPFHSSERLFFRRETISMSEQTRYVSIGTFTLDPAHREAQRAALEQRIAPMVARMRGFVTGFWCEDTAKGLSHHYMVFDDETGVRALHAQIERDSEEAKRHGVRLESLSMMPVITVATATSRP
jgi:hypothetical protein